MESIVPGQLAGWEIHGFRTMDDLDVGKITEEAKKRWLEPNEIHAMLCNYKCFRISVQPVNLPQSGTIVLFDRKLLKNFRKDGHNWKLKKDGKSLQEFDNQLKVGNEKRIIVYYARGQDDPNFARRCYWLLDKELKHIVLVHYRQTEIHKLQGSPNAPLNSNLSLAHSDPSASRVLAEETNYAAHQAYYTGVKENTIQLQGSPNTPLNSNPSLAHSDPSVSWFLSEETNSAANQADYTVEKANLEPGGSMTEMRLHEINRLEWEELLVPDDLNKLNASQEGTFSGFEPPSNFGINEYQSIGNLPSNYKFLAEETLPDPVPANKPVIARILDSHSLQKMAGQINSVDFPVPESSIQTGYESFTSPATDHKQSSFTEQIFTICNISPSWASSTEETKILVVGFFHERYQHLAKPTLYCVCGDARVPAEEVRSGEFSCVVSPHSSGLVNFYLSSDGRNPVSQVLSFEYRAPLIHDRIFTSKDSSKWEECQVQMRLAHLLFSTSNKRRLSILSSKVQKNSLEEAKNFTRKTAYITDCWANMIKLIETNKIPFEAKDLFVLTLKNRLQEWLLERVFEGCKTSDLDDQGQGAIHLCANLGYTWAVYLYLHSGLALDYRDKFGWTALHWAAYCGREKMVATLLSAGAKPNLVTDPTPENPGGCTAADLASKNGYDGLAAYLAEMGLVAHFKDMTIAGNVSGSLQTTTTDSVDPRNLSEEVPYLKDTLAAHRTAVDVAARIQTAFREKTFKPREKAVQSSNPEDEARRIVAAMKIQHAFRKYDTQKKIAAAAQIEHTFPTRKIRKEFLNVHRQAIKIQLHFRGFQVRRQDRKIIWTVGVIEKAILRWRLRRKGFRGLQVYPDEVIKDPKQKSDVEEDFFRASRKQAEERVERSVVRVQAMFRSKKAQEDYWRMKMAHSQARLEYEGLLDPDTDMGYKRI